MLFDPEDGKTTEEILEIVWDGCTPEARARLERLSAVSGRSIGDLILECVEEAEAHFQEDPAAYAAWLAKMNWEAYPYGSDPLLKKEQP